MEMLSEKSVNDIFNRFDGFQKVGFHMWRRGAYRIYYEGHSDNCILLNIYGPSSDYIHYTQWKCCFDTMQDLLSFLKCLSATNPDMLEIELERQKIIFMLDKMS